ncbi:inactive non-canonical poly(a) RNA polymerase protein trf4-2-related [Anaeramoeba flamelloides]|uniref:Inactive non-canonical poly(A) RNA polymerase protein trf4-2-related n=1 Tax=Anaeramoeba flamelloides TaxID=1746091 RepID=A0AAV7YBK8_9EUKA|nr:inactive non-canonical poly(a) RNA polymerase protein trf4-2-related [Anaeramoeba flamelloides]
MSKNETKKKSKDEYVVHAQIRKLEPLEKSSKKLEKKNSNDQIVPEYQKKLLEGDFSALKSNRKGKFNQQKTSPKLNRFHGKQKSIQSKQRGKPNESPNYRELPSRSRRNSNYDVRKSRSKSFSRSRVSNTHRKINNPFGNNTPKLNTKEIQKQDSKENKKKIEKNTKKERKNKKEAKSKKETKEIPNSKILKLKRKLFSPDKKDFQNLKEEEKSYYKKKNRGKERQQTTKELINKYQEEIHKSQIMKKEKRKNKKIHKNKKHQTKRDQNIITKKLKKEMREKINQDQQHNDPLSQIKTKPNKVVIAKQKEEDEEIKQETIIERDQDQKPKKQQNEVNIHQIKETQENIVTHKQEQKFKQETIKEQDEKNKTEKDITKIQVETNKSNIQKKEEEQNIKQETIREQDKENIKINEVTKETFPFQNIEFQNKQEILKRDLSTKNYNKDIKSIGFKEKEDNIFGDFGSFIDGCFKQINYDFNLPNLDLNNQHSQIDLQPFLFENKEISTFDSIFSHTQQKKFSNISDNSLQQSLKTISEEQKELEKAITKKILNKKKSINFHNSKQKLTNNNKNQKPKTLMNNNDNLKKKINLNKQNENINTKNDQIINLKKKKNKNKRKKKNPKQDQMEKKSTKKRKKNLKKKKSNKNKMNKKYNDKKPKKFISSDEMNDILDEIEDIVFLSSNISSESLSDKLPNDNEISAEDEVDESNGDNNNNNDNTTPTTTTTNNNNNNDDNNDNDISTNINKILKERKSKRNLDYLYNYLKLFIPEEEKETKCSMFLLQNDKILKADYIIYWLKRFGFPNIPTVEEVLNADTIKHQSFLMKLEKQNIYKNQKKKIPKNYQNFENQIDENKKEKKHLKNHILYLQDLLNQQKEETAYINQTISQMRNDLLKDIKKDFSNLFIYQIIILKPEYFQNKNLTELLNFVLNEFKNKINNQKDKNNQLKQLSEIQHKKIENKINIFTKEFETKKKQNLETIEMKNQEIDQMIEKIEIIYIKLKELINNNNQNLEQIEYLELIKNENNNTKNISLIDQKKDEYEQDIKKIRKEHLVFQKKILQKIQRQKLIQQELLLTQKENSQNSKISVQLINNLKKMINDINQDKIDLSNLYGAIKQNKDLMQIIEKLIEQLESFERIKKYLLGKCDLKELKLQDLKIFQSFWKRDLFKKKFDQEKKILINHLKNKQIQLQNKISELNYIKTNFLLKK